MYILNPRATTKNCLKRNINKLIEELERNHKNYPNKLREGSKGETKKLKGMEQIKISYQGTFFLFKRIPDNVCRYSALQKMSFHSPSTECGLYSVSCFQRIEKEKETQKLFMEKPTRKHLTQVTK